MNLSKKVPRDLSELPLSQPRYLGKDTARIEDATLLTGRAEFGDNVAFPGMLFAAILRSPHAHARIVRLNLSPALKSEGVFAAYDAAALAAVCKPWETKLATWPTHRSPPAAAPMPTTCAFRACCTRRSCAARMPMRASCG